MKFITRSLVILLALYGMVFALVDVWLWRENANLWLALGFAVLFIGVQYLLSPYVIQWVMDIDWTGLEGLPEPNRQFVEKLCHERGLKIPRIGIIHSGTPNAFSFGHTPSDARVVVTQGLLDVLNAEESNAVLAHEIGHIEHWDFAVMTVAALVPLMLYQIYVFTRRDRNGRVIAYGAYLAYLVSQFVVLLLNRTREYYADHYSAEVTGEPNQLSSALVKIAYGMVRVEGEQQHALEQAPRKEKKKLARSFRWVGALNLLGISNLRSGSALMLSGTADPAAAARVMRWDIVNPWAQIYELNCTHPLTAKRVRELNSEAEAKGQVVPYRWPVSKVAINWLRFALEVFLWAAPMMAGALLFSWAWLRRAVPMIGGLSIRQISLLLLFIGVTWMLRIAYRYHGKYCDTTVGKLIEDVEVSEMKPRAVRLTGKILGRGVPGAFWSADLVLQDASGIIFILNRQSIPFARLLFALGPAQKFEGQQVVLEGFYRRGIKPYVELTRLISGTTKLRAYSRWIQYALAAMTIATGIVLFR